MGDGVDAPQPTLICLEDWITRQSFLRPTQQIDFKVILKSDFFFFFVLLLLYKLKCNTTSACRKGIFFFTAREEISVFHKKVQLQSLREVKLNILAMVSS